MENVRASVVLLRKCWRVMKISVFLVILSAVQIYASDLSAQKVSLSGRNLPLKEVLSAIEKQTGYLFFYDESLLKNAKPVTVSIAEETVNEALDRICSGQNFTWTVEKQTITLVSKPVQVLPKLAEPAPVKVAPQVSGRVTDESGNPLPGASIQIKGTMTGTVTDMNGNFSVEAEPGSVLIVSFIGFFSQEVAVGNRSIFVVLQQDISSLDEVQVIGYGVTTRRLSTSSVSSVRAELIEQQSVVNPIQALQGRAAGMYVTNTAGAIGASPTIQIRGVSTLNSGVPVANQPLFVLDGAIIPGSGIVASFGSGNPNATLGGYWGQEGGTNPFNFLNPNDIESIEVLKDADATSIYGSRGTNGVIIITTKKGKAGSTKFNFDINSGITQASYVPERLRTEQYLQLRTDAFAMGNPTAANPINPITPTAATAPDLLTWDKNAYTDWQNFEYSNPARNFSFQGNMSGGGRDLNFLASLGYSKNEDFTRGDPHQQRISGLLNLNHTSRNEKFKVAFSNNLSLDKLRPTNGSLVFPSTLRGLPPNMPLTNSDGSPFWPTSALTVNAQNFIANPYAQDFIDIGSETFSVINNINASYKLLDFITLRLQTGYTNQLNKSFSTTPSRSINPFIPGTITPNRSESESIYETINIEPQINITRKIGKGKFEGLLGTTFFERNTKTFGIVIDGFDTDELLGSWAGGANVTNKRSTYFKYRFNSVFARGNYNYDGKYLLNATFRRDGSSRFGPDKKWADFASIGWGWIFTEENFMGENNFLSYGKIRGSYGTTGNDNINDFRFTSLFTSTNIIYGNLIGLAPSFISVPGFQWETTTKLDFAIELGFLKDRIFLNVNWFRNLSTDLLVEQRIPTQTGFSSYLGNFPGVIENKGWEIELTTNNFGPNSPLKWKTSFNISLLENILKEYPDLENSPNSTRLRLGEAIPNPAFPSPLVRAFIFEGVNPDTGLPNYKDINADGTISTSGNNDRDFVGSTFPKYYGGINNSISYKGFTLDLFVYFARQLTTNHLYLSSTTGQLFNPIADYYGNYWKQPGDIAKYPRLYTGVGAQNALLSNFFSNSTAAIDDVFFAKLKTASISFKLPQRWAQGVKMSDINVYVRGQNLFTYASKKIHKDPEATNPRGIIPQTFITGLNVSF